MSIAPFSDATLASDKAGRKQQQLVVQNHDEHTEKSNQGNSSSSDVVLDGRQREVPEALQERREHRVRYHNDSGWRPAPPLSETGESSVLDVPPQYDAAI